MKKFHVWVVVMVVLASFVSLWLYGHHVIRTRNGTVVLAKRFLTFRYTFVNAQTWTSKDFEAHAPVKDVLSRNGYGDLIRDLRRSEFKQAVTEFIDAADQKFEEFKTDVMDAAAGWMGDTNDAPAADSPQP